MRNSPVHDETTAKIPTAYMQYIAVKFEIATAQIVLDAAERLAKQSNSSIEKLTNAQVIAAILDIADFSKFKDCLVTIVQQSTLNIAYKTVALNFIDDRCNPKKYPGSWQLMLGCVATYFMHQNETLTEVSALIEELCTRESLNRAPCERFYALEKAASTFYGEIVSEFYQKLESTVCAQSATLLITLLEWLKTFAAEINFNGKKEEIKKQFDDFAAKLIEQLLKLNQPDAAGEIAQMAKIEEPTPETVHQLSRVFNQATSRRFTTTEDQQQRSSLPSFVKEYARKFTVPDKEESKSSSPLF